ncbi:HNH endonuclease [Gordonia phage BritBrat]|uniref:HNH endonuclease n=1 Tax=Gordonia phage BritBrat TaxID=1838064 RepID=A0A161HSS2_9CAUD|nr:HNH endonuclease [Gordonia phage BritBrat]ANA85289.1 HNH endonuclease [Gordonia phage BritBrat]
MAGKHRPKMKHELRLSIWRRDDYTCQDCGLVFPREQAEASKGRYCPFMGGPYRQLEIDHITPYSRGGTNDPENLRCLCDVCNRAKLARTYAMFWPERIAEAVRYLESREPTQHAAERAAEILLGEFHTAGGPRSR